LTINNLFNIHPVESFVDHGQKIQNSLCFDQSSWENRVETENLLNKYLKERGLKCSEFSRLLKCKSGCVYKWINGTGRPAHQNAWKIHKMTKGEIPISYWGYAIINGKMKRLGNEGLSEECFKRD